MTLGYLLTGIIFAVIGAILYYCLLTKTKGSVPKQKISIRFFSRSADSLFRPMIGSIFILLGLLNILTFCLGIDTGNYTIQKEDNINILNGITILICMLSLEGNITYYLRKFKKYRYLKKNQNADI